MEVLSTLLSTFQLHTAFFGAKLTLTGRQFVLHDGLKDLVLGEGRLELYPVVGDFDQSEQHQASNVIEMPLNVFHGEVGLAAYLAGGFADVVVAPSHEGANLAVELVLRDLLQAVAGLVETGVAVITVHYEVLGVALGAEAYFAVSLKQSLQLLHFGVGLTPLLLLHTVLFPLCQGLCLF